MKIEKAKSERSLCRRCHKKIPLGQHRIEYGGSFYCYVCAENFILEKIKDFEKRKEDLIRFKMMNDGNLKMANKVQTDWQILVKNKYAKKIIMAGLKK